MSEYEKLLPHGNDIAALLSLPPDSNLQKQIEETLLKPIGAFLNRSGKKFRTQILEFGFDVADDGRTPKDRARELCAQGAFILESIHAATMVVDDIEDESMERRGEPTLHRQVGLPIALNAGNWLYFWPLERLKRWGLPMEQELKVYRLCMDAIVRAHLGQAIDVGVPIDSLPQERVYETCMASMELKTGALMALAATLGGALGNADEATTQLLGDFGRSFGIALQMFDDIGNLSARTGQSPDPKQYEDLKLRRPSWVWAVAAETSGAKEYDRLRDAVKHLPDPSWVESWLNHQALAMRAKAMAIESLDTAFGPLEDRLGGAERLHWLREIGERLRKAYD
jgi:geranylgeranyl pyrophosphate synthase